MSYWEKVGSRLDWRGLLLVAIGAALTYGSGWIAGKLGVKNARRVNIVIKVAGLIAAVIGGLILLDFIG